MGTKQSKRPGKLMSYQEYLEKYSPRTSTEEKMKADDPKIVGISLARQTLTKFREMLISGNN